MNKRGDFDIAGLTIDPTDPTLVPAGPARIGGHKARRYFVKVPLIWVEKLEGACGRTYRLALRILFLHFRERGGSIILSNKRAGMPGQSKRNALRDLQDRGLVAVQRRERRAPVVEALID